MYASDACFKRDIVWILQALVIMILYNGSVISSLPFCRNANPYWSCLIIILFGAANHRFCWIKKVKENYFSILTRKAVTTGWWDIDIHGCYLVKIAFAPICACKNNRRIWRHNVSVLHSRDVTDQLWWRHNTKSEKTVLSDNGEISDR